MNYFVLNKSLDYRRGYMEGCAPVGEGISLKEGEAQGIFFSRVMDSRERGNVWHRMTCSLKPERARVSFLIYSSDERTVRDGAEAADVEEIGKSRELSGERKLELFAPYLKKEVKSRGDVLLHEVQGRYLWFAAFLYQGQEEPPRAGRFFFYFPKETWMKYLPGVYQKDRESARFLEDYLGIFQSFYDDLNREIETGGSILDPKGSPTEFLQWLAGWLDIGQTYLWEEKKLRELIRRAPELYKKRGTRKGMLDLIALYTGEEPYLVETWQLRPYVTEGEKGEQLKNLYGEDENVCTLLLKEEYLNQAGKREAVLTLAAETAPAHMEVRLAALRPCIFLGEYSYLGINSRLGSYRDARLDGLSQLPYAAIGGERREDRT